jgi:hypothetical protein
MSSDMRDDSNSAADDMSADMSADITDDMSDLLGESDDGWSEPGDQADDPDIELITDYLTNQASPEQVTEYERRLEEDDAFRELAAPLIVAWSVPPLWKREPMPRSELVRSWDEFTKRAGFVHQREKARRRRRRWMYGLALVLVALVGIPVANIFLSSYLRSPSAETSSVYVPVADSGGWMSIGAARVRLDPGARLLRVKSRQPARVEPDAVRLEHGTARFVYRQPLPPRPPLPFTVFTKGAILTTNNGEFRVDVRGDTTEAEVFRLSLEPMRSSASSSGGEGIVLTLAPEYVIMTSAGGAPGMVPLLPTEVGHVRWGGTPVKLRVARTAVMSRNPLVDSLMKNRGGTR